MTNRLTNKAIRALNKAVAQVDRTAVIVEVIANAKHNTIVVARDNAPNIAISNIPCTPKEKSWTHKSNHVRQALSRAIRNNTLTESA